MRRLFEPVALLGASLFTFVWVIAAFAALDGAWRWLFLLVVFVLCGAGLRWTIPRLRRARRGSGRKP
jgi:hypothetical protein